MRGLLQDPIVWMCLSVLTFGLVLLIYLIGKFKQASAAVPVSFAPPKAPEEMFPFADQSMESNQPVIDFSPSAPPVPSFQAPAPAPVVPANVITERLDTMVQRLGDMQNALLRQANQPSTGMQGLPPETVDKLLKIIGNVVQQIDVLQKNIGAPATASAAMADMTPPAVPAPSKFVIEHTSVPKPATPAATPAPAPSPSPVPSFIPKTPAPAPIPAAAPAPAFSPKPIPSAAPAPIPSFAPKPATPAPAPTTPPPTMPKPTGMPPAKNPSFGPTFGNRPPGPKPYEPGKPA